MSGELEKVSGTAGRVSSSVIRLSDTNRFYCLMFGLSSAGFAGWMLWLGKEGAATVAFVVLGAILMLLAIAGVIPRRIKWGDNEAELVQDREALKETTDNALASMTTDELRDFLRDTLQGSESSTPRALEQKAYVAGRIQSALSFEYAVFNTLLSEFGNNNVERTDKDLRDFRVRYEDKLIDVVAAWTVSGSFIEKVRDVTIKTHADLVWVIVRGDISINLGRIREQLGTDVNYKVLLTRFDPDRIHRARELLPASFQSLKLHEDGTAT